MADIASESETEQYVEIKELELKQADETAQAGQEVRHCVVVIPGEYVESQDVEGMYIHKRNPLDSSNIYYTATDNQLEGFVSGELTAEEYEKEVESAYEEAGTPIDLTVKSFDEQDMDGIPAYVIRTTYEQEANEVEQLIYLILADKTYTITFSQAADDELMANFEISEDRIMLIRK